jgi:hypothetical protein
MEEQSRLTTLGNASLLRRHGSIRGSQKKRELRNARLN